MGKPLKEGAVLTLKRELASSAQHTMANGSHNHGALTAIDPEPIIQAINAGQSLRQIAAQLNVSNVALRAWLLREDAEQYRDAITNALTIRIAEADEQLDKASDPVSIARARESARYARMDFERRRPHLYGQRPTQIAVSGNGVTVQLVTYSQHDAQQQPIDVTPSDVAE